MSRLQDDLARGCRQAPFTGFVPNVLAGRATATAPTTGMTPLVARLLTVSIVTPTLCEVIAMSGGVLFMIAGQYFPRRSLWEAWAQQT